jgi:hypothetical protein
MAEKWIQKAIKKPGALRATAKRMKLLKEGETLSASDLTKMKKKAEQTGNKKLMARVNLAKTLKKMKK